MTNSMGTRMKQNLSFINKNNQTGQTDGENLYVLKMDTDKVQKIVGKKVTNQNSSYFQDEYSWDPYAVIDKSSNFTTNEFSESKIARSTFTSLSSNYSKG